MIKLFLLCFIIFVGYYCIKNKIKVKFKTFLKRGFKINKGIYGIYCYCGFQGNGKTYSCVEYLIDNYSNLQIFSNVHVNNINYIYYNGFDEMLKLRDSIDFARSVKNDFIIFNGKKYPIDFDKQIIFVYDEIFSELQRGSKINTNVLDFITQMRKRGFILLTTAQVWNDIPITWRRLTRFQIDCSMRRFLGINILVKVFHDAEQMKWSNDDQEFIAPIINTTITHTRKFIANSYDTFQLIHNKQSTLFKSSDFTQSEEVKKDIPQGEVKGDYNDFLEEEVNGEWYEEETRTDN